MHEVVVTGYGVFTAFGFGREALEKGVFSGEPAFTRVSRFDSSPYRAQYAAEYQNEKFSQMRVLRECVKAALSMAGQDGARAPVLLGTNGDHAANIDFWSCRAAGNPPEKSDVMYSWPGLLSEVIGDEFHLGRPRLAFVNACVAATNAIAYGAHLISTGKASSVICGGASMVNEDDFAKFDSGRALTTEALMRPFSRDRKGLLHGDGAAVLVLESAEYARQRNAVSYGRILGWGLAADAYHPVQPHPQGLGLAAAAQAALQRAGLTAKDIGYVNAHGTGTPRNDAAESMALRHVFGGQASTVPVSSTKSTTGHMLEATGAVEAVITLVALEEGVLPPTAGFLDRDPECVIDCIPHTARLSRISRALSLNAAFGGANAALVLGARSLSEKPLQCREVKQAKGIRMPPPLVSHRAIVSAVSLVPWGKESSGLPGAAPVELPQVMGFAISRFGPLVHAAAAACLGPANTSGDHVGVYGDRTAIVLVTMYGDATTVDTATQWTVGGKLSNPLLFFQSVSTSILSHLTRRYGIQGPLTCISAVFDPAGEGLRVADVLLDDPDLYQVLLIGAEIKPNERVGRASDMAEAAGWRSLLPAGDAAAALLLRRVETDTEAARLTLTEVPLEMASGSGESPGPLGWLTNLANLCAEVGSGRHDTYNYTLSLWRGTHQ